LAQKSSGVLRIPALDSPASMSIHEESTIALLGPMMGVFNNLVMFDQHIKQNSIESIVPDLAAGWSWNGEGRALAFTLVCGAERNYTGYCSAEFDALVDRQSMEADPEKRKQLVWEIERKLAEDGTRPVIFYPVSGACWQPYFKGHTMMVNGNYNGWRLEDAWLDN
jgi:hypothetical protein